MSTEPEKDFFDRFGTASEDERDCPPHEILVSLAKGTPDSTFAQHIGTCRRCTEIVGLLRATNDSNKRLQDFLAMTRERALEYPSERPSSIFSYLRTFFIITPIRRGGVVTALSLIVLIVVWGITAQYRSQDNHQQSAFVNFEEDKFWHTVESLQGVVAKLPDPNISTQEKRNLIEEANQRVREIEEMTKQQKIKLNSEQRAELAVLVAKGNSEIALLKENQSKPTQHYEAEAAQVRPIATNSDSQKVTALYTSIDQAISKKKPGEDAKPPTELSSADAVRAASQQVNVVAINEQEIVLQDRLPNRPPEQVTAIKQNIDTFYNDTKVHVRFIPTTASTQPTLGRPSAASWSGHR
jgi:hypothetical protein